MPCLRLQPAVAGNNTTTQIVLKQVDMKRTREPSNSRGHDHVTYLATATTLANSERDFGCSIRRESCRAIDATAPLSLLSARVYDILNNTAGAVQRYKRYCAICFLCTLTAWSYRTRSSRRCFFNSGSVHAVSSAFFSCSFSTLLLFFLPILCEAWLGVVRGWGEAGSRIHRGWTSRVMVKYVARFIGVFAEFGGVCRAMWGWSWEQ